MHLALRALFLLGLMALGSAMAQTDASPAADPLNTPQCRAARTRLDVATTAAVGRHEPSRRALQVARERVAQACFGQAADTAAASGLRAPQPPATVQPVIGGRPSVQAPAPPMPTPPAPPLVQPRAAVITQCDPTGCWDSSGRRLNRVGPGLAGPGGPCTVQGNAALCP